MLACQDVRVRFGAFVAVDGVSLDFEQGGICSVIGPNGAGKTTLLNALSGRVAVNSGRVLLYGEDVTRLPAHRRAAAGLGRAFQIVSLFPEMTVFENFRIAAQACLGLQPFWRPVRGMAALREKAATSMERVGLKDRQHRLAGSLAHGEQRALELGLALVADPPVLLLDEPLAGVGHAELRAGMEMLQHVLRGRTVVLVEHNMDLVMAVSDRIAVLAGGRVLAVGDPASVRSNEEVRRAYLG